ncbi:MAG: hypothetical protein AAGE80_17055 [Pseudomonadota bacterium]
MTERPATMSSEEVAEVLPRVAADTVPEGEDAFTRLAWRPAWSIRSRRGAFRAFCDWVAGR